MGEINNRTEVAEKSLRERLPSHFVIVIGRQFGSGGRTIGKILATRLGISYYDTELLNKAAEKEGLSPEVFKRHDEKKPSFFKVLLQGAYGIPDNFHTIPLGGENTYSMQVKVIKEIAQKGPCVIVGRNADFILRDHPHLLSVFLHSPLEHRAKRIVGRSEAVDIEAAMTLAEQKDKHRESYYNYYTGEKKWGVASNYHLSLDTSCLDNENVVDTILALAESKWIKRQK